MSHTITIRRILCPVDYSPCSRRALAHAAALARRYDATVTVLHAYTLSPPPFLYGEYPGEFSERPPSPPETDVSTAHDQVLTQLARFTEPIQALGVPLELEQRQGGAVPSILDCSQTLPADVIVMGTHGRSGMDRLVLGSVTEKVLRKASCPVLTVPPPALQPADEDTEPFQRILCAVDFSAPSMKALQYALSLADGPDTELLMIHVIEGIPDASHWQQPDMTLMRYLGMSEAEARARLQQAVPMASRTGRKMDELLATGKPYREILRVARERDVHLIVLGVHGRNPLDVMLFGSTTQHVVRKATCPVLTLRT